ncbi:maleylpyruvate isomerase N-terminal domain-containing protein [Pedococcus bigeumensis]|uniref:maleylpyruvate isomerase N-terminal domain-containing protein n=1 Tax=Pedococcus bigeumensis TaxID=433644 RepID=UPI002FED1877
MSRAEHAAAFLSAVDLSLDLAARPQVRDAWGRESACAGMTVGGLTHHLLKQAGNTVTGLRAAPDKAPADAPVITVQEHYARAAWVEAAPDDDVNVSIREGDNEAAEVGPDVVLELGREWAAELPSLLGAPRQPDTVFIPWQGWSLSTEDFLTTRMMEMVVHGDDLAASVGVETPTYPDDVLRPVLGLLTGVAVRRHGQTAVVRGLSRPQRAPGSISAF